MSKLTGRSTPFKLSLKGGYISWLLDAMKEDEVAERDIKADVSEKHQKEI